MNKFIYPVILIVVGMLGQQIINEVRWYNQRKLNEAVVVQSNTVTELFQSIQRFDARQDEEHESLYEDVMQLQICVGDLQQKTNHLEIPNEEVPPKSHEGNRDQSGEGR